MVRPVVRGRRRILKVLVTLVALTAAGAPGVSAQAPPDPEVAPEPAEIPPVPVVPNPGIIGRLFPRKEAPGKVSGWYLLPHASIAGEYDSNLFGDSSGEVSDVLARPRLGLGVGYFSPRLVAVGTYARDGEFYADRSDLNSEFEGQLASVDVNYSPTPRMRLELNGTYLESPGTRDIQRETGQVAVDTGLQDVTALSFNAFLTYQLTPRLSADARYEFLRSEVDSTDTSHRATLGLVHQFTALDRGTLRYRAGFFTSDTEDDITSHEVRVGWIRRLGPNSNLSVDAGPQFAESDVDVVGGLRLDHSFGFGTASVAFERNRQVVVGLSGARITQTASAAAVFDPLAALRVRLDAGVSFIEGNDQGTEGDDTQVYSAGAEVSYVIVTGVAVRVGYRFSYERDGDAISRHLVTIGFDFTYPVHVY
jgi:opacity protein-like surface antigen